MTALAFTNRRTRLKRGIALAMLCAALGYACALACGVYPPQHNHNAALMAVALIAPAAYIVFRAIAHKSAVPNLGVLLQHCSIALAIVLLPMLFAAESMPEWMQIASNAGMLACAGIAALGVLSMKHSPAQALVIMTTCGLGLLAGSRGLAYAGLGSMALHATTAVAIAALAASAPLFTRTDADAERTPNAAKNSTCSENAPEAAGHAAERSSRTAIGGLAHVELGEPTHDAQASAQLSEEAIRIVDAAASADATRDDSETADKKAPESAVERMAREFDLSNRERDLLALIVQGADNKRISEALFISPNTVKTHLRNIYGKLGVHSKEGIITLAKETMGVENDTTRETAVGNSSGKKSTDHR